MANLLIMGKPGAGKGTQAQNICEELNIAHVSTGDIFRQNIKNETKLGVLAKSYMDQGLYVPDKVTNSLVEDKLNEDALSESFLLDGFPRTLDQVIFLEKALSKQNRALDAVLVLDVADEEIVKRISNRLVCPNCGRTYHKISAAPKVEGICDICDSQLITRTDDSEEKVLTRLRVYNEETKDLIDYYKNKGLVHTFDASKSVDSISKDLVEFIKGLN